MKQQENKENLRHLVRRQYGKLALSGQSGCGCSSSSCCGASRNLTEISHNLGYSGKDLDALPEGANLGLGCGNPHIIAALHQGEFVLDLGSGSGFDCFLAARTVGPNGKVIGVDMTAEMIEKARQNAENGSFGNVEFRLGELENLPVADGMIDVIISNCVVNLSPEKEKVFKEAFRVLRPGGRLAISDVVAIAELPETLLNDVAFHIGCITGAVTIPELTALLQQNGFAQIQIKVKDDSGKFIRNWMPERPLDDFVASATIEAVKPIA